MEYQGSRRKARRSVRPQSFRIGLEAEGAQPPRTGRGNLREVERTLRGQRKNPGRSHHALSRADGHAERDRWTLERTPAFNGPSERGNRPARLCAAGPAGGIQTGILRYVRGDDGKVPGRYRPVPVPDADSWTGWAAGECGATTESSGPQGAAGSLCRTAAHAGCGTA